jgi:hypothetical protein
MGMIVNGFDLFDFRQQLRVGRLRVRYANDKEQKQCDRNLFDHLFPPECMVETRAARVNPGMHGMQ